MCGKGAKESAPVQINPELFVPPGTNKALYEFILSAMSMNFYQLQISVNFYDFHTFVTKFSRCDLHNFPQISEGIKQAL